MSWIWWPASFCNPGTESVFSEHAFAVYAIGTQAVGATARVAKARDYGHDLEAMAALVNEHTRVVWIANPNNPTGTWLEADSLAQFHRRICRSTCVAVVDEAYTEYVEDPDFPDATRWLDRFPNLIVTRTFSKVHGLAALRVGYGLSHPQIADLLNRVRQPFNVNSIAQAAALAALGDGEHVRASVALNRAECGNWRTAPASSWGSAISPRSATSSPLTWAARLVRSIRPCCARRHHPTGSQLRHAESPARHHRSGGGERPLSRGPGEVGLVGRGKPP